MEGTMDVVGVYELGNPKEIDVHGDDWFWLSIRTQQAIMASAPAPPENLEYSTGIEWLEKAHTLYILLYQQTKQGLCYGWRETDRTVAVKKALGDGKLPGKDEGVEINTDYKAPKKGTPEYTARMGFIKSMNDIISRYEDRAIKATKALKGEE